MAFGVEDSIWKRWKNYLCISGPMVDAVVDSVESSSGLLIGGNRSESDVCRRN